MQSEGEKGANTTATGALEFQKSPRRITLRHCIAAVKALIFYGLIIWIPACWIFGSTYNQKHHIKNMNVIIADLDGSGIGRVVTGACTSISGDLGRPTFELRSDVSSYSEAYDKVYNGEYWGGVVIQPGATERFTKALTTGDVTYDPSSAVTVIYNSARWPATTYGFITPVLSSLVSSSVPTFTEKFVQPMLKAANGTLTPESYSILFKPYTAAKDDIQPFDIGARYFLGTVGFVFPAVITFFVCLGLRTAYEQEGVLRKFSGIMYRAVVGAVLTFMAGLFYALWVLAFREDSSITAKQFMIIWMIIWLYGYACFWFFDIVGTACPVALIPPVTLTFVVIQVTASAFPNTIKHKFYRIEYIMPSHHAFELFVSTISKGAVCHADRNVPALFAWIIFWFCMDYLVHLKYTKDTLRQQTETETEISYGSDVTAGR